ncbi:MAG: AbiV family abortive infection protein [Candidatus Tectomicrobia bacterium]|nr:AbiV family abortive infection protein [Candidatus Tectomicrobia bacterium]
MKRAVADLARFPDNRLFHEVSEGIAHIVTNAVDLNEAALRLARADQVRASDVLRRMAEEEAAKVLILIDAIRCPQQERGTTLKRFYDHLAKRIYAAASSELRIDSFEELRAFVDLQRRPRLLDGPNDVDWIVGNELLTEREQGIYVDFIQDTTDPEGEYFWSLPFEPGPSGFPY